MGGLHRACCCEGRPPCDPADRLHITSFGHQFPPKGLYCQEGTTEYDLILRRSAPAQCWLLDAPEVAVRTEYCRWWINEGANSQQITIFRLPGPARVWELMFYNRFSGGQLGPTVEVYTVIDESQINGPVGVTDENTEDVGCYGMHPWYKTVGYHVLDAEWD